MPRTAHVSFSYTYAEDGIPPAVLLNILTTQHKLDLVGYSYNYNPLNEQADETTGPSRRRSARPTADPPPQETFHSPPPKPPEDELSDVVDNLLATLEKGLHSAKALLKVVLTPKGE